MENCTIAVTSGVGGRSGASIHLLSPERCGDKRMPTDLRNKSPQPGCKANHLADPMPASLNDLNEEEGVHVAKSQTIYPDDLMVVTVSLEFRAKINPEKTDAPAFETTSVALCLPASESAEYVQ